MPKWLKNTLKIAAGVAVIGGLAVATAVTGGTAGVIAGAALTGAISGGASGAVIGAVTGGIKDGWKGAFDGAIDGFLSGTCTGAITGALSSGASIATGTTQVIGKAQSTGTMFHKFSSNFQSGKMAIQYGRYSKIGRDRSLKTMGLVGTKRPDVTGVARYGTNKIIEVASKSQKTSSQIIKCQNMVSSNPGTRYKVISWGARFTRFVTKQSYEQK